MTANKCIFALFVCLALNFSSTLAHAQTVNVISLGAKPDLSNPAATTLAFWNAFNLYPNAKIVVPPGIYAIDNSQGALFVGNFSGEIDFQGGAELLFQSTAHGGLRFVGGTGARIYGLHGNYATIPVTRTEEEFAFTGMIDLTVSDAIAQNSPGMGFLFTLCVRPKVTNVVASSTIADGLAFANCQNAQLVNYTAEYTVDNGLAFYNYGALSDWNGATAKNIHIIQVLQAHGIAVAGTSNVAISDFTIDTTSGDAIWVSQDSVYATRNSYNVVIQHGVIRNAGVLWPNGTNNWGIEFTESDNVTFADIQISGSASRAVAGTAPSGHIRFHNIRVTNNQGSDAFVIGPTAFVEMADCVSENSPNNGFSFDGVAFLVARNLKVINSSAQSGLHRAMWFQNGGVVMASDLQVIDDRQTPSGYVVGASDGSLLQRGSIQGITSAILNGALVVNKYSPLVTFSNTN